MTPYDIKQILYTKDLNNLFNKGLSTVDVAVKKYR